MTDPGQPPEPHVRNVSLDDVQAALARIERAQAALQKQVEALQDHSNLVGYLVEQVLAKSSRASRLSQARRSLADMSGSAGVRLRAVAVRLRPLLQPAAAARSVRRAIALALVTSRRAHWSRRQGRWRQRLNLRLFASALSVHARRAVTNHKQQLYSVAQRRAATAAVRPRIMHIIPNVHVGGSTQLIVDLLDHLGHKYEMQVVTSSLPSNGTHHGMIVHDLHEPTSTDAMLELFGKFAPDLLHVHYWGATDLRWYEKAFAAARRAELAIVENVNTPVAPYVDESVARYVYVSDYVRREFGTRSERETVIHPGVDLARFSPRRFDPHALDSIGMVYRLEPDKLNADSIEPLIWTVRMRPKTRAFVIGAGSLFEVFLRRVEKAGVRDNFAFPGYVPYAELPAYYAQFRTFVAPVWQESFGQVTVFAMNMGLAVAGNNVGALSEILASADTLGGSVEETATKLAALLDNPDRIVELGARNRARAQSMFEVEEMCRRYGRVYEDALGRGDPMPGFPPADIFAEP
jgi:glycosyltransferase involved in cell wall biosynthesis